MCLQILDVHPKSRSLGPYWGAVPFQLYMESWTDPCPPTLLPTYAMKWIWSPLWLAQIGHTKP